MRASFVFHLETKVLESGGKVEKLIAQVAWSPVLSFHSLWWFGVQCHLLVLVHFVFWKPMSLHPFTKKFWSTSCFLLLTSFLKMLISFSSRIWHLPTLPTLGLIRPQDMATVIHIFSLLVFSELFVGFFCASSLEEASFWDDSHPDQLDAVCGVWSEHWQADTPPLQPLQQCWQHSHVYFPNTTSGYDAEHVHSTSLVDHGEACSEWNLPC